MKKDLHNTIRQIIKEIRFTSSKANYLKAVRLKGTLIVPYEHPDRSNSILYIEGKRDVENNKVIFYPNNNDWDTIFDNFQPDLDKRHIPYKMNNAMGEEVLVVDYSYFETEVATNNETLHWVIEDKEWYNTF
jgi:hypothetical protein